MSLTTFEIRKIICRPLVWIALAAILALDVGSLLFGSQWDAYKAGDSPLVTDISRLRQNGAFFAGEITEEWFQTQMQKKQKILENPENQVSDGERQKIREEYFARGYSEEYVDGLDAFIYLKPEVLMSNEYNKYEDVEVANRFYTRAAQCGKMFANEYRTLYPGRKGEILAAKTEEMYGNLVENHTAFYNYDYGYWKLRNIHSGYPFSVGLFILIGLSPVFSSEYSRRTDALILSSKHGKKKLISAKIAAGLIVAAAVWGLIELLNTLIVFGFYGTTGAEAYWQNFLMDYAPFPFNQLQVTLITIATSLLGTVFFASVVLLISVCSKNQFVSLLIGGILLLVPCMDLAFADNAFVQSLFYFMPTRLLTAICEWQRFDLLYLFGKAIPVQAAILAAAVLISALSVLLCRVIFKNKQVEN